jgi:uncharacterized protein
MTRSHARLITLSEGQCRDLLRTHQTGVGRIAFAEDGNAEWPSILPVNYAYRDGAIFFRTFEGSKLYTALRRQRVAFEIDDVDKDWRQGWSIVALGTLDVAREPGEHNSVDQMLRSWAADEREHLVRLDIERLTGREVIGP